MERILKNNGLDPKSSDALRAASGSGRRRVLLLLQHGAGVNVTNLQGNSALHCAVRNGRSKVFKDIIGAWGGSVSGIAVADRLG